MRRLQSCVSRAMRSPRFGRNFSALPGRFMEKTLQHLKMPEARNRESQLSFHSIFWHNQTTKLDCGCGIASVVRRKRPALASVKRWYITSLAQTDFGEP